MHLLMIAMLYAAVVSFIALIFQYINVAFPDVLDLYYPSILDTIRRSEATLFIVFPVYIALSWLVSRDFAKSPTLRDFKLRKWLVYFTLFISAVTIIVDLVALIYNFLGGDLTTPFALKVLTVLATAAAVFGYYLWDLRRSADVRTQTPRIAAGVAAFVVLASIIAGFFIVGSPQTQRARRFDEQRIQNLQILQGQIVNYWMLKEKLPESLAALEDSISGFTPPTDPETMQPYEYHIKGRLSFELCAVFMTDSAESNSVYKFSSEHPIARPVSPEAVYGPQKPDNWNHGKGRICFSRTIDPELYKPQKPLVQ